MQQITKIAARLLKEKWSIVEEIVLHAYLCGHARTPASLQAHELLRLCTGGKPSHCQKGLECSNWRWPHCIC
jgi:hypothetical protein